MKYNYVIASLNGDALDVYKVDGEIVLFEHESLALAKLSEIAGDEETDYDVYCWM